MSCKSAIYTSNTTNQALEIGNQIAPGTINRRFGSNVNLAGNGITITGSGYYDIDAEFTIEGTATGNATISLYKDGVAIPGIEASVGLADGSVATIGLVGIIRQVCCNAGSTLTFILSGVEATITNAAIVVSKL